MPISPTVWCNLDLPEPALAELRDGTRQYRLILGSEVPQEEVAIALGQPDAEAVLRLQGVRWIQVTTAGYTRYDTPEFRERLTTKGAMLSNSSSVFDEPCAQHLLAFILAFARRLPQALIEQIGDRAWSSDALRSTSRLLQDQTVLLVGYGAIARRFAELVAPFHMNLVAVRRSVRGDEGIPTYPIEELDRLLPDADHVANILPANASTEGLFGKVKFDLMKSGAFYYNIGRGTTVDQEALIEALQGKLQGAYLDVTDPEPLPSGHPLWSASNCFITPHTAGGHEGEWVRLVRHFLSNLRHFEAGEPLLDRVM